MAATRRMLYSLIFVLIVSDTYARSVLQDAASAPQYAPAPRASYNGVDGFSCPTPGSTGYLFQTLPCAYGTYAGRLVYCDEPTEGGGVVGIRGDDDGDDDYDDDCTASTDCDSGYFCNIHFNGTCTPVAPTACFDGAPAPAPVPAALSA